MKEVKVKRGVYAGQYVSVESLEAAEKEFGEYNIEVNSLRDVELYNVYTRTADGDMLWKADLSLKAARNEVGVLADQGRSGWYLLCE